MPRVTMMWGRRRRIDARIAELRRALAALGDQPTDAIGRWRHQEETWRLERELDRLLTVRRGRGEAVPA
jgi:hypothetical protein